MKAIDQDTKAIRDQLRWEQWTYLKTLLSKWMPIATAEKLEIQRWKMEEGSKQPFMDENAVEEQLKATNEVVKILARMAKLLGLDLQDADVTPGGGPKTLQELQLWMINRVHDPSAKSARVLEITSGIPGIDETL